ncbi:MAG: hypothetical protein SFZ03_06685 [Candidatus Melainabacteria bacterium]|nr:hypothetical protein [Candidatus Melainabacteria bacterium]
MQQQFVSQPGPVAYFQPVQTGFILNTAQFADTHPYYGNNDGRLSYGEITSQAQLLQMFTPWVQQLGIEQTIQPYVDATNLLQRHFSVFANAYGSPYSISPEGITLIAERDGIYDTLSYDDIYPPSPGTGNWNGNIGQPNPWNGGGGMGQCNTGCGCGNNTMASVGNLPVSVQFPPQFGGGLTQPNQGFINNSVGGGMPAGTFIGGAPVNVAGGAGASFFPLF